MARGVCPECGTAPCALRPVCPGEPEALPYNKGGWMPPQCRTCARGIAICDGGCDLPPFTD
jgi:hypothetical protein